MTRFDITKILNPAAIKPRTSGPRDGTHATTTHTESPAMRATPSQPAVLAAIQKQSPITRAELIAETNLSSNQLSNALYNLKKTGQITGNRDNYALATGTKSTRSPDAATRNPGKPTKKPRQPTGKKLTKEVEQSNGHKIPIHKPIVAPPRAHAATAACIRAIETMNDTVIILDGNIVVAEITSDQARAVQAVRLMPF